MHRPLTPQRVVGLLPILLLLSSACDRPHPAEALVHSAQIANSDPAGAARDCDALEPKAAGECLALLAGQIARQSIEGAGLICERVEDQLWQDECWFLVAESTAATHGPAAAVETCGRAGQFTRNCLGHLWLDAATRAHKAHPTDPTAAWEAYAPTAPWQPESDTPGPGKSHRSTFFDARFNPTGAGDTAPPPIDVAWCASFPDGLRRSCRQTAAGTLQRQLNRAAGQGVDMSVLCSDAPLAERVALATGVRWQPDETLDRRANQLVTRSCQPISNESAPR